MASEVSDPADSKSELALETSSSAKSQALEVAIPAHIIPLCLQLGGIKSVYKCQVESCMEGPSTSHAAICACVQRAFGGGVDVSLLC